jgi:hypothetical protein
MHINSHFTPANFGASSRPDHAANPSGRAHQIEETPEDVEAATTTDTATAAAATEETEIPGRSVAHTAREQLNTLQSLSGHNFGWLVSQIAQGTFDPADYATPDEGTEGEATTASSDETADVVADPVADPVVNLIDELLEDSEEDGEDGSEVT